MPEKWTGNIVGKLHNNGLKTADVAAELGVTRAYVSMVLSGKRKPPGIRKRMERATEAAIRRKQERLAEKGKDGGDQCQR